MTRCARPRAEPTPRGPGQGTERRTALPAHHHRASPKTASTIRRLHGLSTFRRYPSYDSRGGRRGSCSQRRGLRVQRSTRILGDQLACLRRHQAATSSQPMSLPVITRRDPVPLPRVQTKVREPPPTLMAQQPASRLIEHAKQAPPIGVADLHRVPAQPNPHVTTTPEPTPRPAKEGCMRQDSECNQRTERDLVADNDAILTAPSQSTCPTTPSEAPRLTNGREGHS